MSVPWSCFEMLFTGIRDPLPHMASISNPAFRLCEKIGQDQMGDAKPLMTCIDPGDRDSKTRRSVLLLRIFLVEVQQLAFTRSEIVA